MNGRRLTAVFVVVAAITLLSACGESSLPRWPTSSPRTPVPTLVNRGLAYGVPCKPPCWEGLLPGVSTEDEVQQTLQHLQENGEISAFRCEEGGCMVGGVPGTGDGWVSIWIEDGMAQSIQGDVAFDLSAQQVVNLIGEPRAAYVVGGGRCSTCQATGGQFDIPIHIFYPDLGAWFLLLTGSMQAGCICPDARVIAFEYFRPMPITETLDYLVSHGATGLQDVPAEDLVKWHGFGSGYSAEPERRPIFLPLAPTEMPILFLIP